MASKWTVKPLTDKYDLTWESPDGETLPFWIKLKRQLTVGEDRKIMTAGWQGIRSGGRPGEVNPEVSIDWQSQSFARAEVYVTDWSLDDEDQRKLPLTRETMEALHPELFRVIENAITAHVEARAAQKKMTPTGSSEPAAT